MLARLLHTNFFRHVSVLQVGAVAQFAISFVGSVLIARLLGPASYGTWALAAALMGFFSIALDWGQAGWSLILFARAHAEKDAEEMRSVGGFYIRSTLLLYGCIGLPLFVAAGAIGSAFYHRQDLGDIVRFLIAASAIAAGWALVTLILQVVRRMWLLVVTETADQLLKTGGMLAGLFAGFGVLGVAAGQAIGTAISFILAIVLYRTFVQPSGTVPHIRSMLQRARAVPLWARLRSSLLVAVDKNLSDLGQIAIMLLLGRMAGVAETGFFRIALSYISLSAFVLGPVTRLLYDQFPKDLAGGIERMRRNFLKVSVISGVVCAATGAVLVVAGPFLVKLVYGQSYAEVGQLIRVFWLYTVVLGFGVGVGSAYRALGKVQFLAKLNAAVLVLGLPLCVVLLQRLGVAGAVYGYTAMRGAVIIIGFFGALRFLRREPEPLQA